MRPIYKGTAPRDYRRYSDAASDLIERIGDYCCYCERQIETNLAVEHVQPKSYVPELLTVWSNFLLACSNCNSSKGSNPINLDEHFWPDRDNTILTFAYLEGGLVEPGKNLSLTQTQMAKTTINLLGLDRVPGRITENRLRCDKRWLKRHEIWEMAKRKKAMLQDTDTNDIRETIVELAKARGMFSIWWTVFEGDLDMRRRLRCAFPGTDASSFDPNENAVSRQGGMI